MIMIIVIMMDLLELYDININKPLGCFWLGGAAAEATAWLRASGALRVGSRSATPAALLPRGLSALKRGARDLLRGLQPGGVRRSE